MNGTTDKDIRPKKKGKFKKYLILTVLSLVALWFIYYFICGLSYSDGSRSGILTKISRKGYIFKTYEGEMNVGGFSQGDGTIMPASIFYFSVKDKNVYRQLEEAQGKRVVVHYKQVYKSFSWQGDTDYFVYALSNVKQISSP
jgi:hypothetical protein